MSWYMGLDKNNKPNGWSNEPSEGYIEASDAVRLTHEQHPDFIWIDGELVAFIPPEPEPYVPTETERVQAIWQGAHDYEYAQISGSAIGMLAIGILQQLPKALAVQGWIQTIWTEYYTRKATGSFDADYSLIGPIPHSVPELMAELGV